MSVGCRKRNRSDVAFFCVNMRNYCVVDGCKSQQSKRKGLSFFTLPMDDERRKQWIEVIGRPDLLAPHTKPNSHLVCSLHFDKSCIEYTPHLKRDAVPTKALPNQPITSEDEDLRKDVSRQTDKDAATQTEESLFNIPLETPERSKDILTQTKEPLNNEPATSNAQSDYRKSILYKMLSETTDASKEDGREQWREMKEPCLKIMSVTSLATEENIEHELTTTKKVSNNLEAATFRGADESSEQCSVTVYSHTTQTTMAGSSDTSSKRKLSNNIAVSEKRFRNKKKLNKNR